MDQYFRVFFRKFDGIQFNKPTIQFHNLVLARPLSGIMFFSAASQHYIINFDDKRVTQYYVFFSAVSPLCYHLVFIQSIVTDVLIICIFYESFHHRLTKLRQNHACTLIYVVQSGAKIAPYGAQIAPYPGTNHC